MTLLIAKIAGPWFLLAAAGFLVSRDFYSRMIANQNRTDPVTLMIAGLIALFFGLWILVTSFFWQTPVQIIISILGIISAIKGAAILVIPEAVLKLPRMSGGLLTVCAAGMAIIGAYLTAAGYGLV